MEKPTPITKEYLNYLESLQDAELKSLCAEFSAEEKAELLELDKKNHVSLADIKTHELNIKCIKDYKDRSEDEIAEFLDVERKRYLDKLEQN